MTTTPADLVKVFADLNDEALFRRLRESALTAEARVLAIKELRSRGIDPEAQGIAIAGDDGPGSDDGDDAGDIDASDSLTIIARFSFAIDAQILQARLEADGIPAWVVNAHTAQAFGPLRNAVGGVRVMVPTDEVENARRVIAALAAGEYALDEDDGVDPGTG